jgi:hypothetical protein
MRLFKISALLFCALAAPAQAGVFGDDFSRCLVTKATEADQNALMAWMFSAISADPQLQKFTTLDRAKRDQMATGAAAVFQRLMMIDCRKEAVAALRSDGETALTQSFGELGKAATRQMFQSPQAQTELESLGKNFDTEKMKALAREAGIADKPEKK